MSTQFRLHPEPGTERDAKFSLASAVYNTIRTGGIGSALLVPQVTLPIWGVYVVVVRSGYWTPELERGLAFGMALLQGLALGSAIALSVVRYSASGKAIKGRRIEKTATDEEDTKQHRIEVALRASIYFFIASIWWEYLVHSKYSPIADEHARNTSSGFLTATGSIRKFFNNESVLPQAAEVRDQISGVGLNYDLAQNLDHAVKNSPRVQLPGTASAPAKSFFLKTWEKIWGAVTSGPRIGYFEIGPKNWK